MNEIYQMSGGRLLIIASPSTVGLALHEHIGRPVISMLTSHSNCDPSEFEPLIRTLLDAGCECFVCLGAGSEALHDHIDELLCERPSSLVQHVMTTWHDDETLEDAAGFFFDIAGAKADSLLVAALGATDTELARLLGERAASVR